MRKLFNSLLVLLMTLSLCGCHGSTATQVDYEVPDSFDETKEYTITFWAKNDTNVNQVNVYKQAISEFESYYPNIHVELKLYTDYGRIYNDVITNISTNTTPNVCITYPDHIATYLTGNNTVVPLTDLINDSKYGLGGSEIKFDGVTLDDMVAKYLYEGVIDDEFYALPFMRSSEALYINKTYVEALGYEIPEVVTWDFIWEVSDAAMAQNEDGTYKINGQNTLIPFIYKSTDNMMIQMLKQLDAPYSDDEGNIYIFNDYTSDILKEVSKHAELKSFSTFAISSYPANFFNAGQCIFAIDSTAGSTWMGSDAPLLDIPEDQIVEFETVVKTIPQYDTENTQMISQGPSICIFNKEDSGEVLASWLFSQYLLTNDIQLGYSETEGYIPVTNKAIYSDEYQEYLSLSGTDNNEHYSIKIDASKLVINNIDNTFTTSVFNGSASLRNAAGELIEYVCKDVKKNKTIDDAYISELYDKVNSLYHLDETASSIDTNKDLGDLPIQSTILLCSLGAVWIGIICVYLIKNKKNV